MAHCLDFAIGPPFRRFHLPEGLCQKEKQRQQGVHNIITMAVIRRGEPGDLAQIAAIQEASPEAPDWNAADYLNYDLLVAVYENAAVHENAAVYENVAVYENAAVGKDRVVGFLASRTLVPGEREILNLAVAPEFRRQGIARHLWEAFFGGFFGTVFLEVREANEAARKLYLSLGFQEVGRRPGYYDDPLEAAIVMKFHSC